MKCATCLGTGKQSKRTCKGLPFSSRCVRCGGTGGVKKGILKRGLNRIEEILSGMGQRDGKPFDRQLARMEKAIQRARELL